MQKVHLDFHICWFYGSILMTFSVQTLILFCSIVCPRSSDPFCTVTYYIKWFTTSWTYSMANFDDFFGPNINDILRYIAPCHQKFQYFKNKLIAWENSNYREGQTVDKYYFIWSKKVIRCSIIEDLYRGPRCPQDAYYNAMLDDPLCLLNSLCPYLIVIFSLKHMIQRNLILWIHGI